MLADNHKILLLFATMMFFAGSSYADDAHSKSIATTSKARVVLPITLLNLDAQGLDFGSIVIGTLDSRVVVSATPSIVSNVSTGDAVVLTSTPQTAAKFSVSGEIGKTYSINIPSSMTISFGANSLDIDNFVCSNGSGGTIGIDDVFYIGAELAVPAAAIPGTYQGTFNVTVAYN